MYTQCPHCQTIFGVSEEHLSAAFGRVRCGQCHSQFNAKRHLLDKIPQQAPSNDEIAPSAEPEADKIELELEPIDIDLGGPTPAVAEDDVAHIDLPDLTEMAADDETQHEIVIELDEPDIPGDPVVENDPEPEPAPTADTSSRAELDEIFADLDQRLEELSESGNEPVIKPNESFELGDSQRSFNDAFGDPDSQTEDDIRASIETIFAAAEAELIKTDENIDADDEGSAQEIRLDDFMDKTEAQDDIEIIREEDFTSEEETSVDDIDPEHIDFSERQEIEIEGNDEQELIDASPEDIDTEPTQDSQDENPDELPSFTQEELPFAIHEDAEHLAIAPQRSRLVSALLSVSILVLLLAGLFQLALFRNVELANKIPALKPMLVQFCQYMPCQFTGKRDVKRIQLTSRDVRASPDGKSTILINAIFVNRASFAQPYPDILITLSDLTTTVVAQRRFSPEEYLAKNNNLFRLMKPGKPVHISLEVLDPGNDAVNFQFEFL